MGLPLLRANAGETHNDDLTREYSGSVGIIVTSVITD